MKLYEDFAKSRVKKSMEDHLSEGEKSAKAQKTERPTKAKKESGTVCTHVFQVSSVDSLQGAAACCKGYFMSTVLNIMYICSFMTLYSANCI